MRTTIVPFLVLAAVTALAEDGVLDRRALVARHDIEWNELEGQIPLGNGEFCFNADATGLQTFGGNTLAHWGWHSFPLPEAWTPDRVPDTGTFARGRLMGGDRFPAGTDAIRQWMFDNPHRMNLARFRLRWADGRELLPGDCGKVSRRLDLWTGIQRSSFEVGGRQVQVETCVHPTLDAVAIRIESPLLERGELSVAVDFPYPKLENDAWVGDFVRDDAHSTTIRRPSTQRADFERRVDATRYHAGLAWSAGAELYEPAAVDATPRRLEIKKAEYGTGDDWADVTAKVAAAVRDHRVSLLVDYLSMAADPAPGRAKSLRIVFALDGREERLEVPDNRTLRIPAGAERHLYRLRAQGERALEFVCAFGPEALPEVLPTFAETRGAAAKRWETFWGSGGALDLSGSTDPRWRELERRVVLSQYLMAVQSAGSYPSPEIGLMGIDPWRGQFHMEMVWWHLAHYGLWDRWPMAEEALDCYRRFLPVSRRLAAQLGYRGAKWPKSVGPEGRSAPWEGNQVLLWKQPHPLFFAELEYRLRPTGETLAKWAAILEETAAHMADYPTFDASTGLYSLVPAMPPSEQGITRDTVFDLAYWRWGLDEAQRWRERMGAKREPRWDEIRGKLAPLPVVDGAFVHSAEWLDTYTKRAWEHPDPIGVLGMLPPIEGVDRETAHRTVLKLWQSWDWNRCWGWDFPWMAMAAARVGEPRIAVESLLREAGTKNHYDVRGANAGGPCPYLPGNGGLLYAVAMMAAGWDGAPDRHAPGFPSDGSWVVKWEGLKPAP